MNTIPVHRKKDTSESNIRSKGLVLQRIWQSWIVA
jgi:hypothetical protein